MAANSSSYAAQHHMLTHGTNKVLEILCKGLVIPFLLNGFRFLSLEI